VNDPNRFGRFRLEDKVAPAFTITLKHCLLFLWRVASKQLTLNQNQRSWRCGGSAVLRVLARGEVILLNRNWVFYGRWCKSFQQRRQRLAVNLLQENRNGRNSPRGTFRVIVGEQGFAEHQGELVWRAFSVGGNHKIKSRLQRRKDIVIYKAEAM